MSNFPGDWAPQHEHTRIIRKAGEALPDPTKFLRGYPDFEGRRNILRRPRYIEIRDDVSSIRLQALDNYLEETKIRGGYAPQVVTYVTAGGAQHRLISECFAPHYRDLHVNTAYEERILPEDRTQVNDTWCWMHVHFSLEGALAGIECLSSTREDIVLTIGEAPHLHGYAPNPDGPIVRHISLNFHSSEVE